MRTVHVGVGLAALLAAIPARAEDAAAEPQYQTVVTATRSEEPLADTPVATEVITRDEIEASGAENVAEILEERAGAEIVRSFAGANIYLQGLGPEYTLVLVDGQRAIGRVNGAIDLARIPVDNIERIEIVRGASSALYGSDAIGGVVNVITRRSGEPLEAEVSLAYGSLHATDLRTHAGAHRGAWNASLTAGWHRSDAFDLDPSEPSTNGSAFDVLEVGGRLQYRPSSRLRITGGADYLWRDQLGIDASASGAVFDRRSLTEVFSGRLAAAWKPSLPSRLSFTGGYSLFREQFLSDQRQSDALDQYQETREQLAELGAQYERLLGERHFATIGGEGLYETLESERLQGGRGTRRRGAVYLQDEWTLLDEPYVVVVPAVRLDADSQFGNHVSPKLAVRWDPKETVIVRASYGWGFRAPSFKELLLFFENPGAGYVVEGNPSLAPETSQSVNLGAEWKPGRFLWFSANLYHNDLSNLIVTETVDPGGAGGPIRYSYVNVAAAHTQGIELAARLRAWRGLTLEPGYTLTDARDEAAARAIEGRPLHRGAFKVAYRHRRWGLEGSVRGVLVGARPFYVDEDGDGENETVMADPHASLDARLAKNLGTTVTLFIGADNLTGVGDARFLPIPPRTFYGGIVARY